MKYNLVAVIISIILIVSFLGASASYDYDPPDLTPYVGSPWIDEYELVNYHSQGRHSNDGTAIVECENGDILVALFNGSSESPGPGDSPEFYRSTDGGDTFVYDGSCPEGGGQNGFISEMITAPNGTITAFYWDYPYSNAALYFNSFDNGVTWTSAKYVDSDGDHLDISRVGGSFIDDKEILWAYFLQEQDYPKTIWNSSDNGLTWDKVYTFNSSNSNSEWMLSWYGDALQLPNGTIMTINYGWGYDAAAASEQRLAYRISEDYGKTWDNGDHWIYMAKKIRNPQMVRIGDHYFLFGRSGRWGADANRGVIYTCNGPVLDNDSWDSGTYIDSPTYTSAYYSNSRVIHHPDNTDEEKVLWVYARPFGDYSADKYYFFIENVTGAATAWWWDNSNIYFQSINGQQNNSVLLEQNRTFVWTKISNTSKYQLQIANDSDFTDIFLNLTDINIYNYPTNYSSNPTHVTFILPSQYDIKWYGQHYYRVRAYST